MGYVNNLFGTIAGIDLRFSTDAKSFIPTDNKGGVIMINGDDQSAKWLGLSSRHQQKYAYDYCFPVASVVDRLAEYDITGNIEILRATGKGRDNYATGEWAQRMNKLLAQPNPLQNWEQFRGQQVVYKKVFGFCPVLPLVPAGFTPDFATAMINLPPWLFDVESTKRMAYTSKIEEIVVKWKFTICGKSFSVDPKDLFILEDSFMQDELTDFILPQSRLVGLDMAVSNICKAMEASNVLLTKRGPLGFISPEKNSDGMGAQMPLKQKEKDELQQDLARYGLSLSQYQYVVSTVSAKWNPMSFDVRQLATNETVIAGEKAICHRFGFPYVLYEEVDATFANSNTAAKAVYQNNVIPNNTKDLGKYNKFFKAAENNAKISNNYSHIAALQEDELQRAQAKKELNNALKIEYDNNIITRNMWLQALGYDTVPDGDMYAKDLEAKTKLDNKNNDTGA